MDYGSGLKYTYKYKTLEKQENNCSKCIFSTRINNMLFCRFLTKDKTMKIGKVRIAKTGICLKFKGKAE